METKVCARCKQELTLDNFYIAKSGKVNSYCKKCDKERKLDKKPVEPPKDLNFYKICSCCGQKKLATEFNKHKWRKDGLSTQCKECDSKKQKQYSVLYANNEIPKTKFCSICGKEKPALDFNFYSRSPDKLNSYCKECGKLYTQSRQNYAKEHKIKIDKNYKKVCSICGIAKPASEFYKSSYNLDGLQYTCKECEKREERKIYNRNYGKQIIEKKCKICGALFKAARNGTERCSNCRQHSIPETIFIELLKKYNINYETEYRVNNINIWCDFYLPDYNVLIDINPISTHSTIGKKNVFEAKNKNYHINRRLEANNNGYTYISIWDWDKPENIIKAIINRTLKIETQKEIRLFWGKNNLNSMRWGNYNSDIYKIDDGTQDEQQMIAEGWLPIYDDGQKLIY